MRNFLQAVLALPRAFSRGVVVKSSPTALASLAILGLTSCRAVPKSSPLMLSAGCVKDGVYVKNMNSFDWKDVKIQLNSAPISHGFTSANLGVLQAGGSLTIPFGEIYSTDGRKFDRA